jgi:hypothetical protein
VEFIHFEGSDTCDIKSSHAGTGLVIEVFDVLGKFRSHLLSHAHFFLGLLLGVLWLVLLRNGILIHCIS